MTTILVVDDCPIDRHLVGAILTKVDGAELVFAEDGRQALDRLDETPVDLVLTDLLMPGLDGLGLVEAVRQRLPDVPVILMTAHGNESIALEALARGAASYIPKAQLAERLQETVAQVLARAAADRTRQRLLECQTHFECDFLLHTDPDLVPLLVDFIQRTLAEMQYGDAAERVQIGVAIEEAVVNALVHGNLEISGDEVRRTRSGGRDPALATLLAERRREPRLRDRPIRFTASIGPDGCRFVVRDGGDGFDAQGVAQRDAAENFGSGVDRGLVLMRTLMDEVRYNSEGNEVTLVKHR